MRIAYICADPGIPVFGTKGASVHVQEIIRAFRARGADVRLYCTRTGDQVPADLADVPVTRIRVRSGSDREAGQARAATELAEQIIADGADLVYERYSLFSTALARVTDVLGVPGILEANAPLIDEQRRHRSLQDEAGAYAVLDAQVTAAAKTICVSEPVAAWVRARTGTGTATGTVAGSAAGTAAGLTAGSAAGLTAGSAASSRVEVVANGVNTDRITPVAPVDAGGDTAADAGLTGAAEADVPVVVFVGTLKPWHGVDVLVRAAAAARRRWRLRIIGDGPLGESLREQAAELGVDAEFIGAVDPEHIPAALAGATIAVAPYPRTDSDAAQYFSPLKIYEYCAAALAVVASNVGQVPAIIDDGVTGVLVEPSNPSALADAVDRLVADPSRRHCLAAAARRTAVTEHSWNRVLDRILDGLTPGAGAVPVAASPSDSPSDSPTAGPTLASAGGYGSGPRS